MTYPLTTTEVLAIVPGLTVSTTDNSVASTTLTQLISDKTDEVLNIAFPRGYLDSSLTDHQKDLLSLIAQVRIWKDVATRRISNSDTRIYESYLKFIDILETYLNKALKCLYFNKSWKSNTFSIPSVQIASDTDCCLQFNLPTPSSSTKPTNTIINLWSTQWSAVVYSYVATLKNFPIESDINDLPTKVLNFYTDIVAMIVGSIVVLVHSSEFENVAGSHKYAFYLLDDGLKKLELLRKNQAIYILNI